MQNHQLQRTRKVTYTALFAAVATALMYLEFTLPFMPPFLKVDLSGAVTLLAAFMFGPLPAVSITLIKDIIHFFSSTTGGVGELADFIITSSFAVTAALIYRRNHSRKGAYLGCAAAVVVMTVVGMLANKFLLIPFFSTIMPVEAIVSACQALNPLIGDINTYIIFGAGPFNLLKGLILSLLTCLLYKRLSTLIHTHGIFPDKAVKKEQCEAPTTQN